MATFQDYLASVKREIEEVDAASLNECMLGENPPLLVDVREREEYEQGCIAGASWLSRGQLEMHIDELARRKDRELVLYCAGGARSALAAQSLAAMGYLRVRSLAGGIAAWKQQGLAVVSSQGLSAEQSNRYSRHILLPQVGVGGQMKLLKSKVLCVGAGGLGSPAALYLAAAGVGTIGIVDDDVVDLSNLQRQVLHTSERVGMSKVQSAALSLSQRNPDVAVVQHGERLRADNAESIVAGYDLVVDGADNFATRYLVNDVGLKLSKPVVHASIYRFEGQLTVFGASGQPCYRCLYPEAPGPEQAPSCSEAGVLGVLPGVLGVLQATEAIKLLLDLGESLQGRLLTYDAIACTFREIKLRPEPHCPACGAGADAKSLELEDLASCCPDPSECA